MDEQIPSVKGMYGLVCARTGCENENATWYNHSTHWYYCDECAKKINDINRNDAIRLFGHDLCTKVSTQTTLVF